MRREIAVCVDNSVRRRSGCKRMQDLALNMRCRLLSYISCAASSRTCQHVVALRLCSLQPYVPLRAGRCESLPHRSHMTRSDDGQSCLHKPQFTSLPI